MITKFKFTLLFAFLFSFFTNSSAKSFDTLEETEELSDTVAAMFLNNQLIEAFDMLEKYWPLPKNEIDLLKEKTVNMYNLISERYGRPLDYMQVRKEAIGEVASRQTYLVRFNYNAIRLIFTYYLTGNGWMLNAFKWDDNFADEFREVE